jgi:hypothetical protein
MLRAFASDPFYAKYVKMPHLDAPTPPEIAFNPKFYPYFKDALGALDGTHIVCAPSEADRQNCRNRKGFLSLNCLAACSFDLQFTYVLNGWEGSANDATVYNDARVHDFRVPEGRYYLADAGYATRPELLIPYRGVRYHLAEWERADRRPHNKEELFNLRHASARNVVERIFGVLKKRFRILKDPPGYDMKVQIHITPALCALHNFIRRHDPEEISTIETFPDEEDHNVNAFGTLGEVELSATVRKAVNTRRDLIAKQMWMDYISELAERGLTAEGH